jgi:very-short-patch-repair endonuclease
MTPAERILWRQLRGRRFASLKFRRQHVLGGYILDFYCPVRRLVIEVDGETHIGREAHDQRRQQWLEQQGLKVLRFWNNEVYDERDVVLEAIWQECEKRAASPPSPPTPLPGVPGRGEEDAPHPLPLSPEYRGEGGKSGLTHE